VVRKVAAEAKARTATPETKNRRTSGKAKDM
jgi:hypothetical protein